MPAQKDRSSAASGQPSTGTDARQRRRRRARLRALRRLLTLIVVAVLVLVFWQNWDTLAPDRLLARLQDSMNDSGGSFPVDISGTNVKLLARSQNYTVALSDSHLVYYNSNGGELTRYTCAYASALIRTAGKYVLVAEQGGKRLQLTTRSMALLDFTTQQDIITVALNSRGQMAVVTKGTQGYAVQVTVYDRKGKELYSRSRTRLATEAALSPDGRQLALLSAETAGGSLNTVVETFSTTTAQTEAVYSYTAPGTLLYRLAYLSGGRLTAVGENGALLVDPAQASTAVYTPEGQRVLGYAVGSDCVALVTRNYGDTGSGQVVVLSGTGEKRSEAVFTGEFRHIAADGQRFALLTDSYVEMITAAGAGNRAPVAADGQQVTVNGNKVVVLGLSTIQMYDLT